MSDHAKPDKKKIFCHSRKCKCGNDYRAPCEGVGARWDAAASASSLGLKSISKFAQRLKSGARLRSYDAHHIICVASLKKKIVCNKKIKPAIKNTTWCVNDEINMIALPRWPHTFQWYMNVIDNELRTPIPPPFKGLAQHDYDHDLYLDEVDGELDKVATQFVEALEEHDDPTADLAPALNDVITTCRALLEGKSTHTSWRKGMRDPNGSWYMPFSMSSSPRPRRFPTTSGPLMDKVATLREMMLKLPA